jgi:hypothetical protein
MGGRNRDTVNIERSLEILVCRLLDEVEVEMRLLYIPVELSGLRGMSLGRLRQGKNK